jgi:hypothetical protein
LHGTRRFPRRRLLRTEGRAGEAPCGDEGPPVVKLQFAGADWNPELQRGILKHLRAGLEPAGFRVCREVAGLKAPVATVELRPRPGERVVATIEVRDGVTAKRVARDIDLSALPEDGRALGVGVAADELLRASWAELALEGAPPPAVEPPPAVQKTVERSLRSYESPKANALGARAAIEGYEGGLLLYGGDVFYRRYFTERFGGEFSLGVRGAPAESSEHGSVRAHAFGAGANLFVDIAVRRPWKVALEAGIWAARLELLGEAAPGGAGSRGVEALVSAHGGASAALTLTPAFALVARCGAGGTLRSVEARDEDAVVVSASGFEWYAALGPQVSF